MSSLVVIGGGRMGAALVGGLLGSSAFTPEEITVVDPDPAVRDAVGSRLGVAVVTEPVPADGAILAVKPAEAERACRQLGAVGCARLLSVVAGATTGALEKYLGSGTRVVRSMPNTPALVGAGASAISAGASATPDDLDWAERILAAVGVVVRVPEKQLDAVTGLSGSGPAYVFLVAESLAEAGVLAGLDRATAVTLAGETLRGAAELLARSGESAATLRAQVTSPGGTTAAGLRVLEQRGVRAAFLDAVAAATDRSKELGAQS